uniref:Basic tail protein n=1 Tax=Amblyomma maculatum TaxID=34609 RepID=G3MMR3_AMBMU
MATVGLLCVFLLQALDATAEIVRGCDPGVPESQPVNSCNYYCKDLGGGKWMMGYYTNGTKCKVDDSPDGVCLDLGPDKEGCYPKDSPEVKDFFGDNQTTQPSVTEPNPPESGTKKRSRRKRRALKRRSRQSQNQRRARSQRRTRKQRMRKQRTRNKRTKNQRARKKESI